MNIKEKLAAMRAAYKAKQRPANYDHLIPGAQSKHSRKVTIGEMKADRLRIKNARRAENGLPPKLTYAEI